MSIRKPISGEKRRSIAQEAMFRVFAICDRRYAERTIEHKACQFGAASVADIIRYRGALDGLKPDQIVSAIDRVRREYCHNLEDGQAMTVCERSVAWVENSLRVEGRGSLAGRRR